MKQKAQGFVINFRVKRITAREIERKIKIVH